jgi:hypothetical protein
VEPGSTLDDWRKVYGGYAPWLPDNIAYWRERCPQVGALDTGRTGLAPLAGFSTGSERRVSAGTLLPEDTLTLDLADPTGRYLEAGADWALVAPDALVGLRWTVTTPAGTLTRDDQSYRLLAAPTRTRDRWGRDVLRTQAEDWLRAPLTALLGASTDDGVPTTYQQVLESPLRWAIRVTAATTWQDVIAGLWTQLAGSVTIADGAPDGGDVPTGDNLAIFADWLGNGAWPTYRQVLESLQATFGLRSTYDASGLPVLLAADARVDSGYVVSTDVARGGAFPVPWERYERAVSRPQATRVEVWYAWLDDSHPPVAHLVQAGSAASTHPTNTDAPPLGRTETLTSNVAIGLAIGGSVYASAGSVAARRLQAYLGAADQITLPVDCACPPPRMGDEFLVVIPADDISAWYRCVSVTVPLGVGPATWVGQWAGAV